MICLLSRPSAFFSLLIASLLQHTTMLRKRVFFLIAAEYWSTAQNFLKNSWIRLRPGPKPLCRRIALNGSHLLVVQSKLLSLSPLRYPGGKTWLRPTVIRWISSLPGKPNYFIEPFAGGASVSLAVAQLNLSDKIILSEIDSELAAFWATVFSDSSLKLTKKISDLLILRADISRLLRAPGTDEVDIAFKCLVKNRMQHGGVLAPGAALL